MPSCPAAPAPTPAWATRPSGPTASATPATASLLNGVDASNLFNGKSTSQVGSARVVNSTGVSTSTAAAASFSRVASVYLSIGNAIPTPAPETIAGSPRQRLHVRRAAGLNQRRAHRPEHHVRHQRLSRQRSTCIAAPTGSTPRPSSSSRTTTFRQTTRSRSCTATSLGGTFGGPIIKDKLFGFVAYQHLHVSDQEIGDSFLDVPVGLTDTTAAAGDSGRTSSTTPFGTELGAPAPTSIAPRSRLFNSPALPGEPGKWLIPNDTGISAYAHAHLQRVHSRHRPLHGRPGRRQPRLQRDRKRYPGAEVLLPARSHHRALRLLQRSRLHRASRLRRAGLLHQQHLSRQVEPQHHRDPRLPAREDLRRPTSSPSVPPTFPAALLGTASINTFGSNYFPGVSIYQRAGRLRKVCRHQPGILNIGPNAEGTGVQHRRLPEPLAALGQRHLDARQAHHQLRRQLQLHAAQHHRQAHRHRHRRHRRLQPVRAGLRHSRQLIDRLLRHLVPAGQRQPLLPRQPAGHLCAGQVPDHAQPLASPPAFATTGTAASPRNTAASSTSIPTLYQLQPSASATPSPNPGFIIAGNNANGTTGVSNTTLTGRQWGIGPRLGAAWQPEMFHNKVVVRTGIGMYYDRGELFSYFSPGYAIGTVTGGPFGVNQQLPFVTASDLPDRRSTSTRATFPPAAAQATAASLEDRHHRQSREPYGTVLSPAPTNPKASDLSNYLPNIAEHRERRPARLARRLRPHQQAALHLSTTRSISSGSRATTWPSNSDTSATSAAIR